MPRFAFAVAFLVMVFQAASADAATFFFIRHAESTSNAGTVNSVEEALDPPLTERGRKQSIELAAEMAVKRITAIYTSDYQRTKLTIAPTAAHFGLTPIPDARTNEWYFGDIKSLGEKENANLGAIIQSWAAGNTAAKASLPKAESLDDMVARVVPAWEEIINAHKYDKGVVVLVGHGAEIGFVMPYFATNVAPAFAFANGLRNAGIIQVEIIDDKAVVTSWQGIAIPHRKMVPLIAD